MINPQYELDRAWKGYEIEEELGEGAFGKVYRISRNEFEHTYDFAVKILEVPQDQAEVDAVRNEEPTEDSVTRYFYSMVEEIVEEFTLMYRLKGNSNIVSYEDHAVLAKENEFGWIILIRMELLQSLPDILKSETLSEEDYLKLGMDMCRALETCEKSHIIHRDIKPQNIFRSDLGHYKLGDFGIARQIKKASEVRSRKGTMMYMAPEVYQGQLYDSTVDIYSLGILMYCCFNNNRAPFLPEYSIPIMSGDKERANTARLSGQEMPDPCNASPALARMIKRACAYQAKDRYQHAMDFRHDLKKIYDGLDEKTIMDYPKPMKRKASKVAMFGLVAGGTILLGAVVAGFFLGDSREASDKVEKGRIISQSLTDKEEVDERANEQAEVGAGKEHTAATDLGDTEKIQTTVPNVTGLDEEVARSTLIDAGLLMQLDAVYSDIVEGGKIVSQGTKAGKKVDLGSKVIVQLSMGPDPAHTQSTIYDQTSQNNSIKQNQATTQMATESTQTTVISSEIDEKSEAADTPKAEGGGDSGTMEAEHYGISEAEIEIEAQESGDEEIEYYDGTGVADSEDEEIEYYDGTGLETESNTENSDGNGTDGLD